MTSPVPVPSKAAIRALRGLVFGTTCSLTLVMETRRRRINNVQSAISNGQRLRSHERYCADSARATIRALEEEVLMQESRPDYYLERSPRKRRSRPDHASSNQDTGPIVDLRLHGPENVATGLHALDTLESGHPTTDHKTNRARGPLGTAAEARNQWTIFVNNPPSNDLRIRVPVVSELASTPTTNELGVDDISIDVLASLITTLCQKGSKQDLTRALGMVLRAFESPTRELESQLGQILESTAILSRTLQIQGLLNEGLQLLQGILNLYKVQDLPLEEELYLSHDPLGLVDSVLAQDDLRWEQFQLAINVFTPRYSKKPEPGDSQLAASILQTGERLFNHAMTRGPRARRYGDQVLLRMNCYLSGWKQAEVILRILCSLVDGGEQKRAINFFVNRCQNVDNSQIPQKTYYELGDLIFKAVAELGGFKSGQVLQGLFEGRPKDQSLKIKWVMQLLYLEWKAKGDVDETLRLFRSLQERGLAANTHDPEAAFRVMVQIMLEAGDEAGAQRFLDAEFVPVAPSAMHDGRVLLRFALFRAKAGDFAAMQSILDEAAKHTWPEPGNDCASYLVPILKVFGENHTIKETEAFLRETLEKFQARPSGYMLTLVANQYGDVRDVKSFKAWLQYCLDSGLRVEATVCNSILGNCHKKWRFPFLDLWRIYCMLRRTGPDSTDKVTQNILTGAALASPAAYRKVSIRLASKVKVKGKQGQARQQTARDPSMVAIEMGKSMENNRALEAVEMYKSATGAGMPHCKRCLRLFVAASVKHYGCEKIKPTLQYLRHVQEVSDVDIRDALSPLLTWQLEKTNQELRPENLERQAQQMLVKMRAARLMFGGDVLNQAAKAYAESGNHQGAIGLALMAAEEEGQVPGYCVTNFSLLLDSYVCTGQAEMVTKLVDAATTFGLWAKFAGLGLNLLKKLKQWRRKILQMSVHGTGTSLGDALCSLEVAIRELKDARSRLVEDRLELKGTVMGIVEAAMRDVGHEVDKRG